MQLEDMKKLHLNITMRAMAPVETLKNRTHTTHNILHLNSSDELPYVFSSRKRKYIPMYSKNPSERAI